MNGEDSKFRSRRWLMTLQYFWSSTAIHLALLAGSTVLLLFGTVTADIWAALMKSLVASWGIQGGAALGIYGVVNVAGKAVTGRGGS